MFERDETELMVELRLLEIANSEEDTAELTVEDTTEELMAKLNENELKTEDVELSTLDDEEDELEEDELLDDELEDGSLDT